MSNSNLTLFMVFICVFVLSITVITVSKDSLSSLGDVSRQKKYTMYLGTNDKDTLKQEIPTETVREQMHEICMKYADGYTLSIMEGFYRDDAGKTTHEVTLIYVFFNTSLKSVQKIMDEALIKFNQKSILLEESRNKSVFYEGKVNGGVNK